jgi:hypothetical protein
VNRKKSAFNVSLPVAIATIVNIFFVAFVTVLAFQEIQVEGGFRPRWEVFLEARPNEVGDTLAGIFGSMTLIWVVASVFQQSIELRAQRIEFEQIAESQSYQVDVMQTQLKVYLDEQRRREEMRGYAELMQLVSRFIDDYNIARSALAWRWTDKNNNWISSGVFPEIHNNSDKNKRDENIAQFRIASRAFQEKLGDVLRNSSGGDLVDRPLMPKIMGQLIRELRQISAIEPILSSASRERVERMEIKELIQIITKAMEDPKLWRSL